MKKGELGSSVSGQEALIKTVGFPLNTILFYYDQVKGWIRFLQRLSSPSVEILKTQLDAVLRNWLGLILLEQRVWYRSKKSLIISVILRFCNIFCYC